MQKAPVLQREIGASACLNSRFDLVADPYLADTRYPAPAARCDHHDAAADAAALRYRPPVASATIQHQVPRRLRRFPRTREGNRAKQFERRALLLLWSPSAMQVGR